MSTLLEVALRFANQRHRGQLRRDGRPYITHPIRVSEAVNGEVAKVVALLHDVLEDTPTMASEIVDMFGDSIADSVIALSRSKTESYKNFIIRCARDPVARVIKIADIEDNMADQPRESEIKRYTNALVYLRGL